MHVRVRVRVDGNIYTVANLGNRTLRLENYRIENFVTTKMLFILRFELRYLIWFYRYETSRMESLLQRYEQRVFDLEESEVDLRERLTGAQGSLGSLIYWSFVVLTSGGVRPKLPKLAIGTSASAHYIPTLDQSNSIDPK